MWRRLKTYPAWFSQGPAHTSSHVSEATGARCYPSREERGEKNQKYSNNKRSFSRRALVIKNRQTNKLKKIKHSDHAIVIKHNHHHHYYRQTYHLQCVTSVSFSTRSGGGGWGRRGGLEVGRRRGGTDFPLS